MAGDQIEVRVGLAAGDLDSDALAECAAMLSQELADLDVDEVGPLAAGEAPEGAKGVELIAIGALVVKLARSTKVLGQVVDTMRDWLRRNHADSIRLEIDGDVLEIKGASPDEKKTLIDTWVSRHSEP